VKTIDPLGDAFAPWADESLEIAQATEAAGSQVFLSTEDFLAHLDAIPSSDDEGKTS
jgi:hypothetical protein